MRFGVMADTHVSASPVEQERLRKALAFYAAEGAREVFVPGDFTLIGREEDYRIYRDILDEHRGKYPDTRFYHLMGNHELDTAERLYRFLGQRPCAHYRVEGRSFIMASPGRGPLTVYDDSDGVPAAAGAVHGKKDYRYVRPWLEAQLAAAARESPGEPIFVFLHHPLKYTVYVSHEGHGIGLSSGREDTFTSIFDPYPQVVLFSGHIHTPNNHPGSVWQGAAFTAVNVPSLLDVCLETGKFSGEAPPGNDAAAAQVMLADLDNGVLTLRTRDVMADAWLEDQVWRFAPGDPADRPYTPERRREGVSGPPAFPRGAALRVESLDESAAVVSFPQARAAGAGNIVTVYRYELSRRNDSGSPEKTSFDDFSGFYSLPPPDTLRHVIPFLEPGTSYTLAVSPVDAYDTAGDALSASFTVPGETARREAPERPWPRPGILDISCDAAGPRDALGHVVTAGERAHVVYDEDFGGYVMESGEDEEEAYTVELSREEFERVTARKGVTLEILLKTRQLVTEYVNILGSDDLAFSFKIHSGAQAGRSTLHFRVHGGGTTTAANALIDGRWHHVAAVYDGTDSFVYIDGTLRARKRLRVVRPKRDCPTRFAINGDSDASGRVREVMNGRLAFVRLYDITPGAPPPHPRREVFSKSSQTNPWDF